MQICFSPFQFNLKPSSCFILFQVIHPAGSVPDIQNTAITPLIVLKGSIKLTPKFVNFTNQAPPSRPYLEN